MLAAEGRAVRWPSQVHAGEVMSAPVDLIDARASMWEAARRVFGDADAHLVVMDGSRPVGVVNQTTIALQWPCGPLNAHRREIQDLTSRRVHTVLPDVGIAKVAEIIINDAVDAVPVVTPRGAVVGLVTVRNLIELLAGCPGDAANDSELVLSSAGT